MIQLTAKQRDQLMQIVGGTAKGSYPAAVVVLNLADGRDKALISRTCFCSLEEIDRIESAFEKGGVEAVIEFEVQP